MKSPLDSSMRIAKFQFSAKSCPKPDEPEPKMLVLPFINLPFFVQLLATAQKRGDEFENQNDLYNTKFFAENSNSQLARDEDARGTERSTCVHGRMRTRAMAIMRLIHVNGASAPL